MNIKTVFQFYDDNLKPLYTETEARDNSLPVEVLFEIHSAFDHLKRFYVTGEDEAACCRKAYGHLVRGCLDMYKLKLKDFNTSIETFQANIDPEIFRLIDNGAFYPAFCKDKLEIIKLGKGARQIESQEDKDAAFNKWAEVANKIDTFEEKYINSQKISWARTCHKSKRLKRGAISAVFGLIMFIGGIICQVIFEDPIKTVWTKITQEFLPHSSSASSSAPTSIPPPTSTVSAPAPTTPARNN